MIRHDHRAFKRQRRIGRRDILYCLIDHFSVGRQFNVLRAINDRPYIFPKTILLFQRTYCNKICTAGTIVIIFQTISFSLGKFFFIIHLHHPYHYNTYRQRNKFSADIFVSVISPLRMQREGQSFFYAVYGSVTYFENPFEALCEPSDRTQSASTSGRRSTKASPSLRGIQNRAVDRASP